eukprot:4767037-Pyramimonas_sp.AAC.1
MLASSDAHSWNQLNSKTATKAPVVLPVANMAPMSLLPRGHEIRLREEGDAGEPFDGPAGSEGAPVTKARPSLA